jgi:four helix bundle protein
MSSGVRELRVWQESVSLAGDVVRAVRQGMRRETKSVSDAVMTTALAVGSHIADGFARPTSAEQRESYLAAKRALLRLETELAVARHAELIPAGAFAELTTRSGHVSRLLTGYLVYLDRQPAEEATRSPHPPCGASAAISPPPDSARAPS